MDGKKVKEVIRNYRRLFRRFGVAKEKHRLDILITSGRAGLRHCHEMLDQIDIFVDQGKLGKAFRWLGFIQGVMWSQKIETIDELRKDNIPKLKRRVVKKLRK